MSIPSTVATARCFAIVGSLVFVAAGNIGCTSMTPATMAMSSLTAARPWNNASQDLPVADILALWQPGEGRDASGLPTRGFAGQMFFFTTGSRTPIAVDGNVSVLVFDDQGTLEEQQKPIHEFKFHGSVWDSFKQETNLGPAYQLFVPYTRRGSHQASCSLRVKYTGPSGQMILSEAADVVLTGSTPESTEANSTVRPYLGRQPSKMTSETIDMPSRFKDRKLSTPASRRTQLARAGFDADSLKANHFEAIADTPSQKTQIRHASYSLSSVRDKRQQSATTSNFAPPEHRQLPKQEPVSGVSSGDVYKIPLDGPVSR